MGLYRVDEMESLIRTLMREPSEAGLPAAAILAAINDGYKDVALKAFCIERTDSAAAVAGNRLVPFSGHRVNYVEYAPSEAAGRGTSGPLIEHAGLPLIQGAHAVEYAPELGLYVVAGIKLGLTVIYRSPDLDNWTQDTIPALPGGLAIKAIAWDGTVFCAVGDPSNSPNNHGLIMTSPNGIDWTRQYGPPGPGTPPELRLRCFWGIAYGNGIFCAVGECYSTLTGLYAATSDDHGVTWVDRTHVNPKQMELFDCAYGNGAWVAVGGNHDLSFRYIEYSTNNGVSWTEAATYPAGAGLNAVTWDGTVFCAVGQGGGCLTSSDGITWTAKTHPKPARHLNGVSYNGADLFACGSSYGGDPDCYIIQSTDHGESWTEVANPHPSTLLGITLNNNFIVAMVGVMDADGDAYVLSSSCIPSAYAADPARMLMKVRPENYGHIPTVNSRPHHWFPWMDKLVLNPVPDDVYPLKLFIADYPTAELTQATDVPSSLPDEFHPCIVDFVCYVLSIRLKRWGEVMLHYNRYINNLNKRKKEYIDRKAERRAVRELPGKVTLTQGKAKGE